MQAYLKKHGGSPASHIIKVNWNRLGQVISLDFTVQKRMTSPWSTDPIFTDDWSKNWGLWNKDVVEAFLQLRSNDTDFKAPYLEVQVSPLNQPFALIITEPRKTFFAPAKLEFKTSVSISDKQWNSHFELTLPTELKGDKLFGGFFSCLHHDPREYYALEPNLEQSPDFHRPELFQNLEIE